MNKTIEEAKKCICPVMYDANMKLELSRAVVMEDKNTESILNCTADGCMAWSQNRFKCDTCGGKLDLEGDCNYYYEVQCKGKSISVGYCKTIG